MNLFSDAHLNFKIFLQTSIDVFTEQYQLKRSHKNIIGKSIFFYVDLSFIVRITVSNHVLQIFN